MHRYELGDVIATRELSLRDGTPIIVLIGKPCPFPDDAPPTSYFCPYRITGLKKPRQSHAGGVDAVQALTHALQIIGVDLTHSDEGKRGDIVWLDGWFENYGFPPMQITQPPPRPPGWGQMSHDDLAMVAHIASAVHPDYPEDLSIAAERLALAPEGCVVFNGANGLAGYLISHPWLDRTLPALNSALGALPTSPDVWYVHDIALLPEARGTGAASDIIAKLATLARNHGLHRLALTAVNNSAAFWQRRGFTDATTPALAEKLATYGPDARYMTRDLQPL